MTMLILKAIVCLCLVVIVLAETTYRTKERPSWRLAAVILVIFAATTIFGIVDLAYSTGLKDGCAKIAEGATP